MRRAARVDRNQAEIAAALRKVGATVQSLAAIGEGVPVWKCAHCGCEKRGTAHQMRQTYCSRECMADAYRNRLQGSANPNYCNASHRVCKNCGAVFNSYQKSRVYCSANCYNETRPRTPKKQLKLRLVMPTPVKREKKARLSTACEYCGKEFFSAPSQSKRYCSYQCHLDSGGAFRAGLASRVAKMKYGAKKDANHNEIFNAIKEHCAVYDLSSAGCGVPDGLAYVNNAWQLFDVKNPKTSYGRRGLNKVQKKWVANWRGGPVYLIYTPSEAKEFALGNFVDLKVVTPESAQEALTTIGATQ